MFVAHFPKNVARNLVASSKPQVQQRGSGQGRGEGSSLATYTTERPGFRCMFQQWCKKLYAADLCYNLEMFGTVVFGSAHAQTLLTELGLR